MRLERVREIGFNAAIALRAAITVGRRAASRPSTGGPTELFLCIADHFEPQVGRPPHEVSQARVEDWLRRYCRLAGEHRDWDGRAPAHTFFYPWDEYDEWELDRLVELCRAGCGEVELHLHHRDDTEATLRGKLQAALQTYRAQGALTAWPDGRPAFAFVHGNWALDNSRCESGRNFCGVNSELTVLQEEGCYADLTFPSWQHSSQPRQTNSLYYAVDDPARPKSYDRGAAARAGVPPPPGLLMIQGPLVPHLRRRGPVLRPAVDDGDLAASRRYAPERLDRWVRAGISVQGRPDRIFIKLHCHGAKDENREVLLGADLPALFADAGARYNDGRRYRLRYVTAREMFNLIKATEAGAALPIAKARDWLLPPPGSDRTAGPRPEKVRPAPTVPEASTSS
jgi:hypothetical protein